MMKNESANRIVKLLKECARPSKKVAALVAVILFFFPMFFVSCQSPLIGEIKVNVSGVDVATGFSVTMDGEKTNALLASIQGTELSEDSMVDAAPITFLLLGIAIAMLVSAFVAEKCFSKRFHVVQCGLAAAHIIGWIIFILKIKEYVQGDVGNTLEVKTTIFYLLNIITGIVFGIAALSELLETDASVGSETVEPMDVSTTVTSTISPTEPEAAPPTVTPPTPSTKVTPLMSKPEVPVNSAERTTVVHRSDVIEKAPMEEVKMKHIDEASKKEGSVRINLGSKHCKETVETVAKVDAPKSDSGEGSRHFHRPTEL